MLQTYLDNIKYDSSSLRSTNNVIRNIDYSGGIDGGGDSQTVQARLTRTCSRLSNMEDKIDIQLQWYQTNIQFTHMRSMYYYDECFAFTFEARSKFYKFVTLTLLCCNCFPFAFVFFFLIVFVVTK